MGQAPKGTSYNFDGNGLSLIAGAGDFGTEIPSPSKYTTEPGKISRVDDIILCIRATIGDRNWSDKPYCLGRGVAGLRADPEKLDQQYLWHWIGYAAAELKSKGRGATFLQVSKNDIAELKIPLPPLAEQRRIAAILDQADALRQKRRQAIAKLDQLLQSVFLDMFGDPVANPYGWRLERLGKCLEKLTDGTHHSPPIVENGIPYITAKHIKPGRINFDSKPWFISEEDHRNIFSRCDPKVGDVLYIKDGATTGIAAVNKLPYDFSMLSSVALLRPIENILSAEYLESWLNNNQAKKAIVRNMGGAAIKRLTLAKIKQIEIPVPPTNVQQKFSDWKFSVQTVKHSQNLALQSSNTIFSSLQQRAFSGNL